MVDEVSLTHAIVIGYHALQDVLLDMKAIMDKVVEKSKD